jgi:hypothetical protein
MIYFEKKTVLYFQHSDAIAVKNKVEAVVYNYKIIDGVFRAPDGKHTGKIFCFIDIDMIPEIP